MKRDLRITCKNNNELFPELFDDTLLKYLKVTGHRNRIGKQTRRNDLIRRFTVNDNTNDLLIKNKKV